MAKSQIKTLSGWGGYPKLKGHWSQPDALDTFEFKQTPVIARGQGRSYGDAALSRHGQLVLTEQCNQLLHFDKTQGQITAQAGFTLAQCLQTVVPHGWFPAVLPGTQFVSFGGLVAADCHGKNHTHVGSFGNHVTRFSLQTPTGLYECSPAIHTALFDASLGGMGLTGLISDVTCQLIPIETPYLLVTRKASQHLEHSLEQLAQASHAPYSAVWLDCLSSNKQQGRGIVLSAHHCPRSELPKSTPQTSAFSRKSVPFTLGFNPLITPVMKAFNTCYYYSHRRPSTQLSHYQSFFFPLDSIGHWNRLYGKAGFVQYQCVVPEQSALTVFQTLLNTLKSHHFVITLAVLKRLSSLSRGTLSFPTSGYTLSLDIPYRPSLIKVLQNLDDFVIKHQGRIYLAKDAHMTPQHFTAMYPNLKSWHTVKQQFDPKSLLQSALSQRLEITHD